MEAGRQSRLEERRDGVADGTPFDPESMVVIIGAVPIGPIGALRSSGTLVVQAPTRTAVIRLLSGQESGGTGPPAQMAPDLWLDPGRSEVRRAGVPVPLSRLELRLMSTMCEPPVRTWPFDELEASVWRQAECGNRTRMWSAIGRLRKKLAGGNAGIEVRCITGLGFRLEVDDETGTLTE